MIRSYQRETILSNIFPKCLNNRRTRALSADGFILPCCWIDVEKNRRHPVYKHFFKDKLHIDTIKGAQDVENSAEWHKFFSMVESNDDNLSTCKMMCSNNERNPMRDRLRDNG